jgi:Mor family transcriptional regulator
MDCFGISGGEGERREVILDGGPASGMQCGGNDMNPHKTPIEKAQLIILCEQHISVKEMAERFRCSIPTIRNRLREWEIHYIPPVRHKKNQVSAPRCKETQGREKGLSQASLEFNKLLYERHLAGETLIKLAKEYGITRQRVYQRVARYKEILAD